MEEKIYPQGELCVCSVQKREKGFEDYRYMVYLAGMELGFHVVRNPENQGISQSDFEAVLKNKFPVFIMIVGEVSSTMVNEEFIIAKEQCLPILVFLKKNKGKISDNTKNIVENLSKVTYDYECATFETCQELYENVYAKLQRYILDKTEKSPKLQQGSGMAYIANKRLLSRAKRQIIIYQRTSILMLGPRVGVSYECNFYRELVDWLMTSSEEIEFIHVFNWEATMQEMKDKANLYDVETARNNLDNIYSEFASRKKSLNMRYSHVSNSVSYVITDTNLIFIIPIEMERYSIELPSHIMKAAEIDKIKEVLYQKTTLLRQEECKNVYIL